MAERLDVAVIGAGPYGLSVAAHLSGLRVRVFGRHMETWRTRMPAGMLLRSAWEETSLSAPDGRGTIDAWAAATGEPRQEPIQLETFLRYADWFTETFVDELDPVDISGVSAGEDHYLLTTSAGEELTARRLVLAVGVAPFAHTPPPFDSVPPGDDLGVSIERQDYAALRGRRLAIVGGGQSALDAAALAVEAGAETELLVRSRIHWFADREPHYERGKLRQRLYRLAYPAVGYGPPLLNRLVLNPDLFAKLPARWRKRLTRRALRAGGSPSLHASLDGHARITEGAIVREIRRTPKGVQLALEGGDRREADHVIVAAGYRFALDRLAFLSPALREHIPVNPDGWPMLDRYFRSTGQRDLLFVGYAAEARFGPLSRYVLGTDFTATRTASYLRS